MAIDDLLFFEILLVCIHVATKGLAVVVRSAYHCNGGAVICHTADNPHIGGWRFSSSAEHRSSASF